MLIFHVVAWFIAGLVACLAYDSIKNFVRIYSDRKLRLLRDFDKMEQEVNHLRHINRQQSMYLSWYRGISTDRTNLIDMVETTHQNYDEFRFAEQNHSKTPEPPAQA